MDIVYIDSDTEESPIINDLSPIYVSTVISLKASELRSITQPQQFNHQVKCRTRRIIKKLI